MPPRDDEHTAPSGAPALRAGLSSSETPRSCLPEMCRVTRGTGPVRRGITPRPEREEEKLFKVWAACQTGHLAHFGIFGTDRLGQKEGRRGTSCALEMCCPEPSTKAGLIQNHRTLISFGRGRQVSPRPGFRARLSSQRLGLSPHLAAFLLSSLRSVT